MSENILLSVKGLRAYYHASPVPIKAVDNVSFYVYRNEIFGIAGESGCGKSTLAKAILKLLDPPGYIKSGEVLFKGINLLTLKDRDLRKIRSREISYIPQGSMNSLNPVMKIKNQFENAIKAHLSKRERRKWLKRKIIEELLTSVGLAPEVAEMYPHELSGGMKQRVIIAMAIALSPELIIADEPTTALDVIVQRGILQLLSDIKERLKSSIILITHDIAVQAMIADRMGVMYAGKIVEISPVKSVFSDPLHPYTQALISAVPSLTINKRLKGLPGAPPNLKYPPPGCRFHPRCPYMIPGLCDKKDPPMLEVKKNRLVACHLYR